MTRKKKILLTALIAVCSAAIAFTCIFTASADRNYGFSGGLTESNYDLYEKFEVPQGKFGNTVAEHYVRFPDGTKRTSDSFTLTQGGEYSLCYYTSVNGNEYTENFDFFVNTPVYSVEKEDSRVYIGKDEKYGTLNHGLVVNLAEGDKFHYNKVVNVLGTDSLLPAIDLGFYPEREGIVDAKKMFLQFTDIYDAENKITVWVKVETNRAVSYTVSCAANQVWGGYQMSGAKQIYHANDAAGTPVEIVTNYSEQQLISCAPKTAETVNKNVAFYFPKTNDRLCVNYEIGHRIFGSGWHNSVLQNNFADPALHDHPWNGFTTGEVYVDIWFESYNAKTANIIINSICGEDLTSSEFVDDVPPEIYVYNTIDESYGGYAGYYYPVFEAKATDSYSRGNVPVSTNVYYGYSRSEGTYGDFGGNYSYQLDISEGRFLTRYPGNYSIVYRAQDWNGNKTEKVVTVNIKKDTPIVPVSGTKIVGNYAKNVSYGNVVKLPRIDGYGGGVGELKEGAEIRKNGEGVTVQGDAYNGFWFIPETAGKYEVSVFAEDVFGVRSTVSYELTATGAEGDKLIEYVSLPKYFIEGFEYRLPDMPAVNSLTGVKGIAGIRIKDGNGTREYNGSASFTPDENGNTAITYYSGDGSVEYIVPVITVMNGDGDMIVKDYFVLSEGLSADMEAEGIVFNAETDGEAAFVNKLIADGVSLSLKIDPVRSGFDELEVVITDAEDASASISVGVLNNGSDNAFISLNGERTNIVANEASFKNGSSFAIGYDAQENKLVCDGKKLPVSKTRYNKAFKGFSSGYVYLTILFKGVRTETEVMLISINNQMMNIDTAMDTAEPRIQLKGSYTSLVYELNDEISICTAVADDVLTPHLNLTVSLLYGDQPVRTENGLVLKNLPCSEVYKVKLNNFGTYVLRYQVKDVGGNSAGISLKIQVIDQTAPALSVDTPSNSALGEVILPAATAKDDISETVTVWVVVIDPQGTLIYVKNNRFTAKIRGEYSITYFAMDAQGNSASKTFVIEIK